MSLNDYYKFKASGIATHYSAGVYGAPIVTEDELDAMPQINPFIHVNWEEDSTGQFDHFLDQIRKINKLASRARIVFYFDS